MITIMIMTREVTMKLNSEAFIDMMHSLATDSHRNVPCVELKSA